MDEQVDVVVLGLGPGGEETAGKLAEAGLSVVGIDHRLVGGECPYWGCIPSKMMIRAANLVAESRRVRATAGTSTVTADWAPVHGRIRDEATDDWDDTVAVERLESKGVTFVRGTGHLDGVGRVVVGDRSFLASKGVVVASGTAPSIPPIAGLASTPYWTNREAIETAELPASIVVIGGGAIGLELSQVFCRFGVSVSVIDVAQSLIALEEPEASELIASVLGREGIAIFTGAKIHSVSQDQTGFTVSLDGQRPIKGERLLVATGRKADLAALGVQSVGLDPTASSLPVDGHCRVADKLWALGDVTGKGAFAHMSMYQAGIVVDDVLGRPGPAADYRAVPRVTFTDPEIGSVGMTERAAREAGIDVRCGISQIPSSSRGWIHKVGNEGFIKLVEDGSRGILVGATSAGPNGGEVLSMLTLAVHAEIPTSQLRRMIYAYPTFHRAVEEALRDL